MVMYSDLERRIREQLDRDEIWRVMQRYGRGLDRLDFEMVRSCYWDDCIEDHGSYIGRPDDFIEWANGSTRTWVTSQHGIMNHNCDLQGNDAYCETYFLFHGVAHEPPHFMSTGRYIDHFQKRNGPNGPEWRFANRITIIEGKFDLPEAAIAKRLPPDYTADEPCQAAKDRSDVSYHRPPVPRRPKD